MLATPTTRLDALFAPLYEPRPTETVSEWCERCVVFDEPKLNGPFSFGGREYMREIMDCMADPQVRDLIDCMGTRTGKTRPIMGAMAWRIKHSPCRCLWTLPATDGPGGARSFALTRWIPMLRATHAIASMIPEGTSRYRFKTLQQMIAGSIIDFIGTGSPKQLGGNPCDVTIQDEVDGQIVRGDAEAHPSILIDQRTKEFSQPKRIKISTPTLETGVIWQELQKTDLRRRFVPCPHCGKFVVFAWSKQFTVFPIMGSEAFVRWDKEAKRANGTWDIDRVIRSARAECPHCGGHIQDHHKTRIDRAGEWRPTQKGASGYRGYHLPSMYSVSVETGFGMMAQKFLLLMRGLQGLKGFITNDLAEPDVQQESASERLELISKGELLGKGAVDLMTVDCQQKAPFFWYVVRRWKDGDSECIAAGHVDTIEELVSIQREFKVLDEAVMLDSGFGAKGGSADVYRNCAEHSQEHETWPDGRRVMKCVGWVPAKGQDEYKRWTDPESGTKVPYTWIRIDPYLGTDNAGLVEIELFEFSAAYFKDVLKRLREGKGGYTWAVRESVATPEYWKHLDGQHKVPLENRRTHTVTNTWVKRSKHWPDHLYACEVMQVAFASSLGLFSLESKAEKEKEAA